MRVTHILVVCIEKVSSVVVGVLEPLKAIEKQGKLKVRFIRTVDVISEDIAWCDTLICVRGSEYADIMIVKAAKDAGRKTIYFLDDDLLDIPQNVSCTAYYNDKFIKQNIIDLFGLCDILWAVNPNIIYKYKKYFLKCILVDACACEIIKYKETPRYPVKFIYAGSIDHENIVNEKLSNNIRRVCEEYGDKVEFTFIGVKPNLLDISQVKYIQYIDNYYEYKKLMNESGFQISFAIIKDTPFYSCKYFNKFLEYSSIGAVGIYSNVEPYTFIIKNKFNGILCDDSEQKWYEAITFLIANHEIREKMAQNAYKLLLNRFTPNIVGEDIVKKLPELVTFIAIEIDTKKIKIKKFDIYSKLYLHRIRMLFLEHGILAIFLLPLKVLKKILYILIRR